MQLVLTNVRPKFLHIFQKHKSKTGEGEPKYSLSLILDKKDDAEQIKKIQDILAALKKEHGFNAVGDKCCLRDGADNTEHYDAKWMYLRASNKNRPQVVDRAKRPVTEDDNLFYDGCRVNAIVDIYGIKEFKSFSASVEVVQFVRDDEPLGRPPVDIDKLLPDLSDTVSGDGLD